jgi:hypothetical protein
MRMQGRLRTGYFPLPEEEAHRIRRFLRGPESECSIVDPCAGCGTALRFLSTFFRGGRYGVELDAYRAEQAQGTLDHIIHGSAFDVHCPVESFSLLYLNRRSPKERQKLRDSDVARAKARLHDLARLAE